MRGFTSYGPHRDDIRITLDNQLIQQTASRGEVRTILLALKIQEAKLLETAYAMRPILLLDDVFGELDGARRKTLTDFLKGYQAFITTTDADIIRKDYGKNVKMIATNN